MSSLYTRSSHRCAHSPDSFCYVCGLYIASNLVKNNIVTRTPKSQFVTAYEQYFGLQIKDQDKYWVPHVFCGSCRKMLETWFQGGKTFNVIWKRNYV